MTDKDLYFYEPSKGHGLKHDPFNAIIAPRPIGWISSRDTRGHVNLAPYSFFNALSYRPPLIGFASTGRKDSLANIESAGEFCWNRMSGVASGACPTVITVADRPTGGAVRA